MKLRPILLICSSAFLLLTLSACRAASPTPTPAPAGSGNSPAASETVAQARIEPQAFTELAFLSPGRVAEVLVKEGDTLTAGQVLARLEGRELRQADLARAGQELLAAQQALADLKNAAAQNHAQADLNLTQAAKTVDDDQIRLDKLKDNTNSKDVDLSQASAQLTLAKAQLRTAQDQAAKLQDGIDPDQLAALQARLATAEAVQTAAQTALDALELRAPSAGTLASLHLKPGEFAPAGQPVATLADFSTWQAQTEDLTELEVVNVHPGQAVRLTLDALPGQVIQGKVLSVAQRFVENRGDTTYTATVQLEQVPAEARWGMSGELAFESGK